MRIKKIFTHSLTLIFFTLLTNHVLAKTVTMNKVAYCKKTWPVCQHTIQTGYTEFSSLGVSKQGQRNILLGTYNKVDRSETKNLVFIAEGQVPSDRNYTSPSNLTGRPHRFANGLSPTAQSIQMDVNSNTLAHRLFAEPGFISKSDTHVELAADTRFNWGASKQEKGQLVSAYFAWLNAKFDHDTIESIYLVGHSRGGALVLQVAERFKQQYPDLPIFVHIVDMVLNVQGQQEMGLSPVKGLPPAPYNSVGNPLANSALIWGWAYDFNHRFSNQNALRIFNVVGGERVLNKWVDILPNTIDTKWIHGVSDHNAHASYFSIDNWYEQHWHNYNHVGIVDNNSIGNLLAKKYIQEGENLVQEYRDNMPPIARCGVSPSVVHGYSATAVFSGEKSFNTSGNPIVSYSWVLYNGQQKSGKKFSASVVAIPGQPVTIRNATLTVTDSNGKTASDTCGVTLVNKPK